MEILNDFLLQRKAKKIVNSIPNPISENIPKEKSLEEISEKELLNELVNRQNVTNWHLSKISDTVNKMWLVAKICIALVIILTVLLIMHRV